jgi:pyruvyl transferase EpsO
MTDNDTSTRGATVGRLATKIDEVLGPLLPAGTPCALLDFPNHSNVGDSAIWLGEREWLRRNGLEAVYACDVATYSRDQLAARLGRGVILLHGGGNLGDLWVEHQWFREQVIQDFPENRILQLPQTIHFLDEWGVGEARRVFDAHRGLTLLCRDRASLDFTRREFAAPSLLCPDMAFALPALEDPGRPVRDVVWLGRTDAEAQGGTLPDLPAGVERTDWLEEPATPLGERNQALNRQLWAGPAEGGALRDELTATYDPLARERLLRGCRLLGRGRAVITDRLHGHILCLLLGIPHVLLDNNYGKVRGFYETWTRDCPLARWAASPAEALALAGATPAGP